MTVIQGCAAATIRGQLLCELRLLTGQIRYLSSYLKGHLFITANLK